MSDHDLIRRGDAKALMQRAVDGYGQKMRGATNKKEKRDWQSMLFAAVDIDRAIAALPAVTVGVKPLVWEPSVIDKPWHSAKAPWGWYYAQWDDETQAYFASLEMGEIEAPIILSPSDVPSIEAAKAAAQADYEARILAALEPVAAPDLTDPVTVHANMLRGTIAKPTVEQIIHLYGVDALTKALAPVIVKEAAPYMTDLMVDPEAIPDMEMEYDHRAGASDDE